MSQRFDEQNGLTRAQEAMTVKRVFGEPYQQDGVTIIPAARIRGGGGGGRGSGQGENQGEGSGYGFGLTADPVGAFVIKDGEVRWVPSVDVNRVIFGGQLVAIVALFMVRSFLMMRGRRRLARAAFRAGLLRGGHRAREEQRAA